MRTSEIVIPKDMDEVFFVTCSEHRTKVGPLTETGAWNVLILINMDKAAANEWACPGEHEFIKHSIV